MSEKRTVNRIAREITFSRDMLDAAWERLERVRNGDPDEISEKEASKAVQDWIATLKALIEELEVLLPGAKAALQRDNDDDLMLAQLVD